MNESEFLQISDVIFTYIEHHIDEQASDLDCQINGNVLTVENEAGQQVIINRHVPNQELWIASKTGGFHFSQKDGIWLSTRDQIDFFTVLNQVLSDLADKTVLITPL